MRSSLTSVLDLVGVLLLVLGIVLFIAQWSLPLAFVVGGVLVLAVSWLVDRAARAKAGGRR